MALLTNLLAVLSAIIVIVIIGFILKKIFGLGGLLGIIKLPFLAVWWVLSIPFKIIGWFFKMFTGIGKSVGNMGQSIVVNGARIVADNIIEGRRIKRQLELENLQLDRLKKEQDNIEKAKQLLKDKEASAQVKADALRSFFQSQRSLLEPQINSLEKITRALKQGKKTSKNVIKRVRELVKNEKIIQKKILDEAREIKELLGAEGDDAAAQRVIAIIQELKPLEEQIKSLENQDKSTLISNLKSNAEKRSNLAKEALDLIKKSEKILAEGILGYKQIEEISTRVGELKTITTELESLTSAAQQIEQQRTQLINLVTQIETNINTKLESLKPLLAQHDAKLQEARRRTKITA
tara:strand:+ start:17475 stop:18527 length:1053 start_codon:yes stop_codon:yes gene_type:complete